MKTKIFLFVCVGLLLAISQQGCTSTKALEEVGLTHLDSLCMSPTPEVPRISEGDFVKLDSGKILTVYGKFRGQHDFAQASLMARMSMDNGSTWGDEKILITPDAHLNVMSVSLLRLSSGKIALFYAIKDAVDDCYPVMRISTDNGESWSEPTPCIPSQAGYHVLNNSRVIQLKNGRILLPVARHEVKPHKQDKRKFDTFQEDGTIFCMYSDDEGATWMKGECVPSPDIENLTKQEPGVVQLQDNSILLYVRTKLGYQYFSKSFDNGITWSLLEQGTLQSPNAPALIIRDPYTDALVAVWNESSDARTPLTIAVSFDEAKTWTHKRILKDAPLWYCYPAIEIPSPNILLISYCFGPKETTWGLGGMGIDKYRYKYINELSGENE